MKVLVWLAAITVGVVLFETVGEWFRDQATQRVCSRHATEMGWELREWEGPHYKRTWKFPGRCVFVDPRTGDTIWVEDRRIDRGRGYYALIVIGSAISVAGIALALMIGNGLTRALD